MTSHEGQPRMRGGLLPTTRLEAFSDGVFAIAITLLVLELDVPAKVDGLLEELDREWPSYVGYFVSFSFIGGVWMAHTTLTRFLTAVDQVLLGLNLVLLLFVSLLPFTTSLMATHLGDAGEQVAVVVFGINLTFASLMVNVVFAYAARTEGLADREADQELRAFALRRRVSVVVQAGATLLGLLAPTLAVLAYLAISVLMLVDPIWRANQLRHRARRTG
jgi:uncharacterized membrane protein